jgi:hypothetical protein
MKSCIVFSVLFLLSTLAFAQKMEKNNIEERLAAIEDKMAIK